MTNPKPLNLKKLTREIANLSAHEYEPNSWWGNDTDIGNLPEDIKEKIKEQIKSALELYLQYKDEPKEFLDDFGDVKMEYIDIEIGEDHKIRGKKKKIEVSYFVKLEDNSELDMLELDRYNECLLRYAFKEVLE